MKATAIARQKAVNYPSGVPRPKLDKIKVTHTMAPEVHEALKAHAFTHRTTASEVIEDMLIEKLKVKLKPRKLPKS